MVVELAAFTLSVAVPVVVRDVGLKVSVRPVAVGVTVEVNATEELKPPVIVRVIVSVTVAPPRVAVTLAGEAESVKFCTVRVTVVVCVSVPLVPVMVSVEAPPATVAGTFTVMVEVPDPVTDAGLKLAVALAGSPLTDRLVAPVRPGVAATEMVKVPPLPPATTVFVVGEGVSEKSATTARVAATD